MKCLLPGNIFAKLLKVRLIIFIIITLKCHIYCGFFLNIYNKYRFFEIFKFVTSLYLIPFNPQKHRLHFLSKFIDILIFHNKNLMNVQMLSFKFTKVKNKDISILIQAN